MDNYKLDKIMEKQADQGAELDNQHTALVAMLALVVVSALASLLSFFIVARLAFSAESPDDMDELYNGWQACMHSDVRNTECMLEYDGDGSSNTPSDWHWYWK